MYLDPFSSALIALIALLASAAMSAGLVAAAARQPPELGRPQRIWARAILLAPAGWLLLEWAQEVPSLSVPGKTLIIASLRQPARGGSGNARIIGAAFLRQGRDRVTVSHAVPG